MWHYLHDLFRRPDAAQWSWLHEPSTAQAWRILAQRADVFGPEDIPRPGSLEEYEQEYVTTFDVGTPTPPCPLNESHWNKNLPMAQVLHDNLRFFNRFGLELHSATKELPDHLRHQLECLHYLARLEAEIPADTADDRAEQLRRARRDFLEHRVMSWVPRAAAALAAVAPRTWPAAWVELLAACCADELKAAGGCCRIDGPPRGAQ